jgi:hypothetical protein
MVKRAEFVTTDLEAQGLVDGKTGLLKFRGGLKTDDVRRSGRQFLGGVSQTIGGLESVIFPKGSVLAVVVGLPEATHKIDRAGDLASNGNPCVLSISPLLVTTAPQPQEPAVIVGFKLPA